jgi:hypothetical protein
VHGSGQALRTTLATARPWQRVVLCLGMILGGVALITVGHVLGVVLVVLGAGVLVRTVQHRIRPPNRVESSSVPTAEEESR